ncbi:BsuBI/PstI family type II restriction endonuclease [Actinomyces naeslundii]|jgi:type II site-specific deoxyribonuclease|uniref:BsuBI/PstI family type II restriction endonuclease n=1 Tax=Actinomyces naeslundii TaxID=1655 RepID=A0AA47FIL8_ACTNA|nr:BsuBI/PstI family type II restriction endonuclease [Actinomyces naeslundii]PKY96145.1 restriction endonuclease [Actinomyces naeslundii]WAL44019.1 BsuBI/PstI family type II restriction endonuclease [Actinomyces naeslundii]
MSTVQESQDILRAFEFDRKRTNETSARTLLALAGLGESSAWADATNERMGVRHILDWMRGPLRHPIAENSRETIRRFVLHQFVDAGFCLYNDDDPARPTNSSKNNYRLNPEALLTIKLYGTPDFVPAVEEYLAEVGSLTAKYQAARDLARIPVTTPTGEVFTLKGGGQNILIKEMVENFCAYFVPGGEILYVGDADDKLATFERDRLASLGVVVDEHGKMPDLVVYQASSNWLFLMEAASTHGPVDHIRYSELSRMFAGSSAGIIYVSCFPNRSVMRRFLADLAWETEVWLASDPTHMIHLNGDRFLGPYPH